jgi:hypothetical protein
LSRACLGKIITFTCKRLKKTVVHLDNARLHARVEAMKRPAERSGDTDAVY